MRSFGQVMAVTAVPLLTALLQRHLVVLAISSISDLPSISKKKINLLPIYPFADDTNIYFESLDLFHLQKTINKELRKVRKWLESNRLAFSIDKTSFVIFHSPGKKVSDVITLKIGRKKIHRENHVRFLGVLLDATLSWKTHINLKKKLSRTVGLFYKIRHLAPQETLLLLYHMACLHLYFPTK